MVSVFCATDVDRIDWILKAKTYVFDPVMTQKVSLTFFLLESLNGLFSV